uniref:NUP50 domain-containing protein n=1 Tax=Ascaris lumbricoides TaxID=6252 RepID=A0A0M3HGI8_ASCLU
MPGFTFGAPSATSTPVCGGGTLFGSTPAAKPLFGTASSTTSTTLATSKYRQSRRPQIERKRPAQRRNASEISAYVQMNNAGFTLSTFVYIVALQRNAILSSDVVLLVFVDVYYLA